jgi:TRAP-type C4-dicarboxylate transport system permease small subunit
MVWGQIMTIVYWLVVIGGIGWTYYYFQPYIKQYTNLYDAAIKAIDTFDEQSKSLPENFKGLFDGTPSKPE